MKENKANMVIIRKAIKNIQKAKGFKYAITIHELNEEVDNILNKKKPKE